MEVQFTTLDWVSNHEQTRWFLVLRLMKQADDALNRLLWLSNQTSHAFGQPLLYVDATEKAEHAPSATDRWSGGRRRRKDAVRASNPFSERARPTRSWPDRSDAFHVSISWSTEKPSPVLISQTHAINESEVIINQVRALRIRFLSVKVKIGNVVKDIPLPVQAIEGKGLISN